MRRTVKVKPSVTNDEFARVLKIMVSPLSVNVARIVPPYSPLTPSVRIFAVSSLYV